MSCRRATSDTTAPGAQDSATIRPLASTLHRRRRPTPTRISIRPRGSEASTIWSTICANRSVQVGSHLATQATRYKVGAELRLRRCGLKFPTLRLRAYTAFKQHFLNFLPLPQGQGSLRPTLRKTLCDGA